MLVGNGAKEAALLKMAYGFEEPVSAAERADSIFLSSSSNKIVN
jgi:hypothetical protein